ncbi:myoD family inhibitor-like [Betta splendens]|uniref:MyoD family inhibitor-like n=1 Tax=Betta splendens TaxID=158456 RepID=A0A8M1HF74_BETSP|nr:myoD family inhibitor-like [Betta splendens]
MEERSSPTEGVSPVKPAQEILSARDPASEGNAAPTELISSKWKSSNQQSVRQSGPDEPTCPGRGLRPGRGSVLPVHSGRTSTRSSREAPHQPATTQSDSCFRLLLACLWCQCSALLLALLEACSSCLHALCASCCAACARCCARCCAAVREAPVEELHCHAHCHAVLFQSCCEPTECLEFCLECCQMCHRS